MAPVPWSGYIGSCTVHGGCGVVEAGTEQGRSYTSGKGSLLTGAEGQLKGRHA